MSDHFVKRAILKSEDGGNTYNVEIEDLIRDNSANQTTRVSLYEQLSKSLAAKRNQPVEGKPEELTAEDQEFVDRVSKQKEELAALSEQDALEFKRQKMMISTTTTTTTNKKSINVSLNHDQQQEDHEEEEDFVKIVIKKKKKKQ